MTTKQTSIAASLLAAGLALFAGFHTASFAADDGHGHAGESTEGSHDDDAEHGDGHGEEGHGDAVELSDGQRALAQLEIAAASAGTLRQTLPVYGRIEPIPSRMAMVQARFSGQIIRLNGDIGESVSRGDVVATVEADDSLRQYAVRAPISGVIVDRMASAGEATAGRTLLRIADYSQVWAQLSIFPSQVSRAAIGQAVAVYGDGEQAEGQIDWIAPAADHGPARLARVVLPNADGRWAPGTTIRAEIVTAVVPAELVVENRAIQDVEGRPAVFVREGSRFEAHPLTLGRSDGRLTEVLGGLESGAQYVTGNSYLLKAELEKSSASHDH